MNVLFHLINRCRSNQPIFICFLSTFSLCSYLFFAKGSVKTNGYSDSDARNPICEKLCSHTTRFTRDRLIFDESISIRHFPDFVCPQNFRNLADWIFEWPNQFFEDVRTLKTNGTHVAPCLPDGSIIYVRIFSINRFFDYVYPNLINNFILITGEGDQPAPVRLDILNAADSKIIHWFGQNGQYNHGDQPKFTHIPIGMFSLNCN